MALARLIYFSENQIDPSAGSVVRTLSGILSVSNRKNKATGVTGALVFDDMWFLQALEGERASVWKTFERISEDETHDRITIAEFADAEKRLFANWWMGLARRSPTTQAAFHPYLLNGRLDPRGMAASQMLALMVDLSSSGLQRRLAVGNNLRDKTGSESSFEKELVCAPRMSAERGFEPA